MNNEEIAGFGSEKDLTEPSDSVKKRKHLDKDQVRESAGLGKDRADSALEKASEPSALETQDSFSAPATPDLSNYLKEIAQKTDFSDAVKKLAGTSDFSDAVKKLAGTSDFSEALKKLDATSDFSEAVKKMAETSDLSEALKKLAVTSDFSDAVKKLAGTSDFSETAKTLEKMDRLSESARAIARMTELNERLGKFIDPLPGLHNTVGRLMGANDLVGDSARRRLQKDISAREAEIHELNVKLRDFKEANDEMAEAKELLQQRMLDYEERAQLRFLLDSVTADAHEVLSSSEQLQSEFRSQKEILAVVVSLDIRRSTELMLKAREPRAFADFLTTLCGSIIEIFKDNYAVIDKFTGDGILAYFPFFFSGQDAVLFALKAVTEANQAFETLYASHRHAFSPVLLDVGLGTGMDLGNLMQVNMAESLTIVGRPVVYACRFACAPAGKIYANQPLADLINHYYSDSVESKEIEISLKHDGRVACHEIRVLKPLERGNLTNPEWLSINLGVSDEEET